jgi:hypothetical protein
VGVRRVACPVPCDDFARKLVLDLLRKNPGVQKVNITSQTRVCFLDRVGKVACMGTSGGGTNWTEPSWPSP